MIWLENMEKTLDELQKKLESAEAELSQRQQSETVLRLENELTKAWGADLPKGDKLDYLKFLASKRFEHDSKRGALADRLGICRDMNDFRNELESSNDVFRRSTTTEDANGSGAVRYITQHQFSHELPRDPKMKSDFLAGRIAVRD